jgi:peptidoglycan hydrolase-like protein with peptidoglycan-binding domain
VRSHLPRADHGKAGRRDRAGGIALLQRLGWSARDAVGFTVGVAATAAIVVNVLFLQSGAHPAPIFKGNPIAAKPVPAVAATGAVSKSALAPATPAVPRGRPLEPPAGKPASPAAEPPSAKVPAPAPQRTPGDIITDIQRELARRGFYEGAIDGLYGPRTDAAIRDFERAAGFKPSVQPNEALLAAIVRAPAKLAKGPSAAAPSVPPAPVRNDPGIEHSAPTPAPAPAPKPSKRVLALQRALADYGYGQIRPTGILDAETQAAIEKFERERRLPVTGQASPRVARELAAMTGRPLE